MNSLVTYSRMIKLSHSIFALPFALAAAVLAARQVDVTALQVVWIVLCMVTARSSAMGFNRIVDRDIDAENPRTATRGCSSLPILSISVATPTRTSALVVESISAWAQTWPALS